MVKEPDTPRLPWCRIETIRAARNISKKLLAERLKVNYSYLVDLLNGRYHSKIDSEKLTVLAETLQMPLEALIKEISPATTTLPIDAPPETTLPPEPPPMPAEPKIIDHSSGETLDFILTQPLPAPITLKLMDDSMSPPFTKGSLFTVTLASDKPADLPPPGSLVVTIIRNGCAWIRELNQLDNEWIMLKPYNKNWEYLQVARKDIVFVVPVQSIRFP